jgi:Glycosyl transferase 4-like domain
MSIQSLDVSKIDSSAAAKDGHIKRVLFVAYAFPPVGGVSVQRVTKFVKYLPEFGWTSSVLTVANPSVPLFDETLLKEIPADTLISRARTLEPGYGLKAAVAKSEATPDERLGARIISSARNAARKTFNLMMQPDSQILWRPHALREGLKLLREVHHDVIVATGPPFSSLLLGLTLSKRSGVPLAVDFRDEWAIMTYWENKHFGQIGSLVQGRMQARVLKAADLVLATTPSTADTLRTQVGAALGHAKVHHIYNGFDATDYPPSLGVGARTAYGAGKNRFRMSFAGTLWNVTPISPVVEGIIALSRSAPELAEKLELVIAGRRTSQQEAELDRLSSTPVKLVRLPFLAHKDAIRLMCQSDALLLINADMPNTERIINAKSFEYMAARRPIFLVAPHGDLWRLVASLPGTLMARPGDVTEIAANLQNAIKRWQQGTLYDAADWDLSMFERRSLAGRLAGLLDNLVATKAALE